PRDGLGAGALLRGEPGRDHRVVSGPRSLVARGQERRVPPLLRPLVRKPARAGLRDYSTSARLSSAERTDRSSRRRSSVTGTWRSPLMASRLSERTGSGTPSASAPRSAASPAANG